MSDSKKKYEELREEYIDREATELCNHIERHLERIITYDDDGFLSNEAFHLIKLHAIKLLKEWHL